MDDDVALSRPSVTNAKRYSDASATEGSPNRETAMTEVPSQVMHEDEANPPARGSWMNVAPEENGEALELMNDFRLSATLPFVVTITSPR